MAPVFQTPLGVPDKKTFKIKLCILSLQPPTQMKARSIDHVTVVIATFL